jgi:predicted MFS family arabinose efflux permease
MELDAVVQLAAGMSSRWQRVSSRSQRHPSHEVHASPHPRKIRLTLTALDLLGRPDVYPTLLAAIGDVAHPSWRASAVGVYRLWRDIGYAFGAVLAGVTADLLGLRSAIWVVAGMTLLSGLVVAIRMNEKRQVP